MAQFSLCVHKDGLKPDSFHFISTFYQSSFWINRPIPEVFIDYCQSELQQIIFKIRSNCRRIYSLAQPIVTRTKFSHYRKTLIVMSTLIALYIIQSCDSAKAF